jgi:hypothetical protein
MFRHIGKRADLDLFAVINLILVGIIIVAISLYLQDVVTDSLFEQNVIARDLALSIDSAYAAPGEIFISYDSSLNRNRVFFADTFKQDNLSFIFKDSNVLVFARPDQIEYSTPAKYPFSQNSKIEFIPPEENKKEDAKEAKLINIMKTKDELNISYPKQN